MAEIQHSAGPWHADPKAPEDSYFEDVNILRPDGLAVAVAVHNGNITPEEMKANAFVLAAAPEMRHALRLAKTWLEGWASAERELAVIDAALSKAAGNISVAPRRETQSELHDRIASEIVASIVKPPLAAGGSFTDVLVVLESVITGVVVTTARMGGDNIVLDAVIDRVRDRAKQALAQKRLGPMSTKGNA